MKKVKYWTITIYCGGLGIIKKTNPEYKIECKNNGFCNGHDVIFNDPSEMSDFQWKNSHRVYE